MLLIYRFDSIYIYIFARCSVYITGAVYRFNSSNSCTGLETGSEELDILTDGDVLSCEPMDGGTVNSFSLFFTMTHRRLVILNVIGSHMNCNPVTGIRVAGVSISHQSYMCKSMFSHSSDRCHYECSCMKDDLCSHAIIQIPSANGGEVCEITSSWHYSVGFKPFSYCSLALNSLSKLMFNHPRTHRY